MKPLSSTSVSFWLFLVAFFLFFLQRAGLGAIFDRLTTQLLKPGEKITNEWRFFAYELDSQRRFFLHGGKLLAELEFSLQELRSQEDQIQVLEHENRLLRRELGERERSETATFSFSGFRQNWFLGGGCLDGVSVGSPVLYEGTLVGQVTEVRQKSAVVATLLDQSWRVPVQIGTSSARGLLSTARGMPEITELSGEAPPESVVVTAGIAGLPPNIALGRMQEDALLDPYFLPGNLTFAQTIVEKGSTCEAL